MSWGSNTISVVPTDTQLNTGGGALGGDFLQYDFNAGSSNPNEAMISPFDSGGGVFIEVNGTYELAGVNSFYAVRIPTGGTDNAYNVTDSSGNGISAMLYDTQGYDYLLGYTSQDQPVVEPINTDTPESSFATRVSSKQNFVGLVDGTIPASQAASHPINDDGLLTLFSNLTTGAITGGELALGGNGADTRLTLAMNSGVTYISSLSIPFESILDITNNKVILTYTSGHDPIASIIAEIKDGYAGGSWAGTEGITSRRRWWSTGTVMASATPTAPMGRLPACHPVRSKSCIPSWATPTLTGRSTPKTSRHCRKTSTSRVDGIRATLITTGRSIPKTSRHFRTISDSRLSSRAFWNQRAA